MLWNVVNFTVYRCHVTAVRRVAVHYHSTTCTIARDSKKETVDFRQMSIIISTRLDSCSGCTSSSSSGSLNATVMTKRHQAVTDELAAEQDVDSLCSVCSASQPSTANSHPVVVEEHNQLALPEALTRMKQMAATERWTALVDSTRHRDYCFRSRFWHSMFSIGFRTANDGLKELGVFFVDTVDNYLELSKCTVRLNLNP